MDCYSVADSYRTQLEDLPLGEIQEVMKWELWVVCEASGIPTTVELVGTIPGCIYTCKDEVRARTHGIVDPVIWGELGRPVLDIHTPEDLRLTHSTRCVKTVLTPAVYLKEQELAVA